MDYFKLPIIFCFVVSLAFTQSSAYTDDFDGAEARAVGCPADSDELWTYRGDNGPEYWGKTFPQCYGPRQSPIRIESSRVISVENSEMTYFYFYDRPLVRPIIMNSGKTIRVIPNDGSWKGIYHKGSLYTLYEIHFHWGSTNRRGSEHVIDNKQYAMEMHLLHVLNSGNGTSFVVVGVFFDQGNGINAELQHIVNELPKVMYKDTYVTPQRRINLINLMPDLQSAEMYQYVGSLTTPDCTEDVSWSLLKTPRLVGSNQIQEFRKLFSASQGKADFGCQISDNFRPLQPLRGRRVNLTANSHFFSAL